MLARETPREEKQNTEKGEGKGNESKWRSRHACDSNSKQRAPSKTLGELAEAIHRVEEGGVAVAGQRVAVELHAPG